MTYSSDVLFQHPSLRVEIESRLCVGVGKEKTEIVQVSTGVFPYFTLFMLELESMTVTVCPGGSRRSRWLPHGVLARLVNGVGPQTEADVASDLTLFLTMRLLDWLRLGGRPEG